MHLSDLNLKQKIGMMMIAKTPVDEESYQFTLKLIRNHSLDGIHFRTIDSTPAFPVDRARIKKLIQEVKETANYPILICEDMENGYEEGEVSLCPPLALGSAHSEEYAYDFGASPIDSHIDMVVLDGDEKQLIERELYPYTYCYEKTNMSGVMSGHIMVPQVDDKYLASLSKKLLTLLRNTGYLYKDIWISFQI